MYTTRWCKIKGKELKIRNKGVENEYEKGKEIEKMEDKEKRELYDEARRKSGERTIEALNFSHFRLLHRR